MGWNGIAVMSKDAMTKNATVKLVVLNNHGALTVWAGKIIKVHCALFYSLSKVDMTSTLRVNAANTARTKPTTGDTKMSFVETDHLGWLKCDGRSLDKTAYNLLFQVVGYTFGGSGNSFNLPNPAGRVMGSIGTVTDVDARSRTYAAGAMVGELDHKLTIPEMPLHNHALTDPGHVHDFNAQNDDFNNNTGYGTLTNPTTHTISAANFDSGGVRTWKDPIQSHQTGITIAETGEDAYHNNVQPTLFYGNTFIYCGIPMVGNFPFKTGLAPVLI